MIAQLGTWKRLQGQEWQQLGTPSLQATSGCSTSLQLMKAYCHKRRTEVGIHAMYFFCWTVMDSPRTRMAQACARIACHKLTSHPLANLPHLMPDHRAHEQNLGSDITSLNACAANKTRVSPRTSHHEVRTNFWAKYHCMGPCSSLS